jgi:hypothetical protein
MQAHDGSWSSGNPKYLAMVNPLIGPELIVQYPEVLAATRFLRRSYHFRRADAPEIQYQENAGLYAGAYVFQMFSFSLEKGDLSRALVARPISLPFGIRLRPVVENRHLAFVVALVTVRCQAFVAVRANPIETLRSK